MFGSWGVFDILGGDMPLKDEKAAALAEMLAEIGEPVVWKGRTFQAFVTDNPLSHELALGGFEAKGDCTIKIPRSAFSADRPKLDEKIEANGQTYRITRVTDHPQYPLIVLVVSLEE
jgi:hypothetical protein